MTVERLRSIEMFLLLSFLLSGRAGTCALPILLSRVSEASFNDPASDVTTTVSIGACAGRSLWDILWSCLATTFACTWVSVHPNIPFHREGRASTRRWRLYLMLLCLVAPEIMILWAFKQLQGALVIMETVNKSYRSEGKLSLPSKRFPKFTVSLSRQRKERRLFRG